MFAFADHNSTSRQTTKRSRIRRLATLTAIGLSLAAFSICEGGVKAGPRGGKSLQAQQRVDANPQLTPIERQLLAMPSKATLKREALSDAVSPHQQPAPITPTESVRVVKKSPVTPIRQVADEQLPPEPTGNAVNDTRRPATGPTVFVLDDGFQPLKGYIPGQSSAHSERIIGPDRGAKATLTANGRFSLPQSTTDGCLPVPRILSCHRPLYFEDALIERHGVGPGDCWQPGMSAAHFYTSIAIVPLKMVHRTPWTYVTSHNVEGDDGTPTWFENQLGDIEECSDEECNE